jgi:hypothetical protein
MNKKIIYLLFIFLFLTAFSYAQIIKEKLVVENMNKMFDTQRQLAKHRKSKLFDIFTKKDITKDEKLTLTFLYAYMPLSDLADYDGKFFYDNIKVTLKAHEEMPWGKTIPENIFINFVLPVRVNNENLDDFRIVCYDEIKNRIQGLSMKEAALEINHWCHEKITYKASDERTSSPLASMKYSFGRCGEESTFTVSAMRAAGIPARQVYTPRWAHTDDNHAWVEIWIAGKWYFLGACEPEPDLDMGWFAGPAARAMLVHTRAYGWYNGSEPVIAKSQKFSELNLIQNYAPSKSFTVKVIDSMEKPVENAKVEYLLYNYAEFYPIASSFTDKNGMAGINSGLGDLLIWAEKDNAFWFQKITVEKTNNIIIKLFQKPNFRSTIEYDFVPPVLRNITEASENGKIENNRKLLLEDSLRTAYMATFKDSIWSVNLAKKLAINPDSTVNIITKSYGNWEEISNFLENTPQNIRHLALQLLYNITEKDLRDTKEIILDDHLSNSLSFRIEEQYPDDFWAQYVMSGRIANENMVDWRGKLQYFFLKNPQSSGYFGPENIKNWIINNLKVDNVSNLHSRAPLTPIGVLDLRVTDNRSRDIFFVAACRSINIPARITQETQLPQYYEGNEWKNIIFDTKVLKPYKKGYIHLTNNTTDITPKYYLTFTIAVYKDGFYRTLQFDENKDIKYFPDQIEVETGKYLLVTGNRLNDGSVLTQLTFFEVTEGKTSDIKVEVRNKTTDEKPWGTLKMYDFTFESFKENKQSKLTELAEKVGAIMVFIDPDKEPSKHVMVDFAAVKQNFEKWGGSLIFILNKEKLSRSFKPETFKNLPAQSIFAFDKDRKLITEIEKLKGKTLKNNYPVIILADIKGNLIFYSEGYTIGVGEQLAKIISKLKP